MGFPEVIDNTIRSSWAQCEKKTLFQHFDHWGSAFSVHLLFGAAFASAIEAGRKAFYVGGLSMEDALVEALRAGMEEYGMHEEPATSVKSRPRLYEAIVSYFDHYNMDFDPVVPYVHGGKPAIEFSFAIPLPINHPDTGMPLIYAGRCDLIGVFNGTIYIVDEKTASRLGPTWSKQFEHDSQFISYTWAAQQFDYPVSGALVRGVCMYKDRVEHVQIPYSYPKFLIDRWYKQLLEEIQDMLDAYKGKRSFQYAMHKGMSGCSYCSYLNACTSEYPQKVLETQFVKRHWNPLTREVSLES